MNSASGQPTDSKRTRSAGKQALRTQQTLVRLLDSAEGIFIRDGYEGAQLEAIAQAAGYSKGAVYTHFRGKEDLFLALFESRLRLYIGRLAESLSRCTGPEELLASFRAFYVDLAEDRNWPILLLEFKLYALRHPESRQRLTESLGMVRKANEASPSGRFLDPIGVNHRAETDLALVAIGPIVTGLMLESYFEPAALTEAGLRQLLGSIFDALFPAAGQQTGEFIPETSKDYGKKSE